MSSRNPTLATAQLIRLPAYQQLASQRATRAQDAAATVKETLTGGGVNWEQSRRERANRLGVEYLPPTAGDVQANFTSSIQSDTDCLRTDGELMRILGIGFKQFHLAQRWVPLHQLSRDTGRQGFTRAEFDAVLVRYGVKGCDTYNTRLLKRGEGFYWRIDHNTGLIYPTGYIALCKLAIQHAHERGLHDLYLYGNHPGQRRDMYISASGSGADFEGAILSAWYGAHGNPTIARSTLALLLNRDARSIRRMERRACICITYNEAQTTDPAAVPLKADGSLRGDVTHDKGVWSYRLPNTYSARMTRQHPYKGQGRQAACWFKHWLEQAQLPGRPQAKAAYNLRDLGKLNRVCRTYCETDKALKSSRKRGMLRTLYVATIRQRRGRVWKVDAIFEDI